MQDDREREEGAELALKFNADGLVTAVATHAETGDVLMLAHMNAEAFRLTATTQIAHFWSRSRRALWKKGETSGNVLRVRDMRIDCDQDAVWLIVDPAGPACHTGRSSCFYRRYDKGRLEHVE